MSLVEVGALLRQRVVEPASNEVTNADTGARPDQAPTVYGAEHVPVAELNGNALAQAGIGGDH